MVAKPTVVLRLGQIASNPVQGLLRLPPQAPAPRVQLEANVAALDKLDFSDGELAEIDQYATEADINLWAASSET